MTGSRPTVTEGIARISAWIVGAVTDRGDGTTTVNLDEAQRAVTPGQAAVFYDGDVVLGRGWVAG